MKPKLQVSRVSFSYHSKNRETLALSDISFNVDTGEFIAIVGPSGCGKSTLLSLLCGLNMPEAGAIFLDGELLEKNPKNATGIGYMFQKDHLFEWRDIFSLMSHSRKKEELKKYIEDNKIEIQKLSLETRWFLAILLEQYTIVDDDVVEVRDVCKAWDGAMQMYADEAREATRKEMKKEMRKRENEKSRRQVFRMFSKGYPQTEIADVLEIPLKTVKRWCAGLTPATEK